MTRRIVYAVLFFIALTQPACMKAQSVAGSQPQSSNTGAQRDSEALAIVSRALSAAGGAIWANVGSYQISATATKWDFAPQSWPVVIAGQPSGAYRFEVDGSGVGAIVQVTNGTTMQFTIGASKPQVTPGFVAASLPIYFPLPYLAQIVSDPKISLSDKGTTTINGRAAIQVDVATVSPTAAGQSASHLDHFTRRSLFFDASTGILIRISDSFYSPRNALSRLPRILNFENYHTDQGLTFPHLVQEQLGSREFAVLAVQSITLNPGLPSSIFSLQQ